MPPRRSKKSSKTSSGHTISRVVTLNDLPQTAIDEILTRLPIETAVSTSRISRLWRHRWKSIPKLNFRFLPPHFVSQALLLHSGPLHTFHYFTDDDSPSVNCWLLALASSSAHSLHDLALAFHQPVYRYHLHSAVFALSHLRVLLLSKCYLSPPRDFSGFKHLTALQLEDVSFPDAGQLSSLISGSPYLTRLCLIDVVGRGCLKIQGPNISYLCYRNVGFDDFALGSVPLLHRAEIRLSVIDYDESYSVDEHDESYSVDEHDEAQWLGLGQHSSEMLVMHGIPEGCPIYFDNLSAITLGIDFADLRSTSATIRLIWSCPNLKELEIERCFLNEYLAEECEDIWDVHARCDLFPELRTVEMHGIVFEESELEFVRLILGTAQLLESMVINFDIDASVIDKESAMMKLLEFRRASNQARILCKHSEPVFT